MHKYRRVSYIIKVDLPSLTIMLNISEYTWGAFGHIIHLSEIKLIANFYSLRKRALTRIKTIITTMYNKMAWVVNKNWEIDWRSQVSKLSSIVYAIQYRRSAKETRHPDWKRYGIVTKWNDTDLGHWVTSPFILTCRCFSCHANGEVICNGRSGLGDQIRN